MADRRRLVSEAFSPGAALSLSDPEYARWVRVLTLDAYRTDLGAGDATARAVLAGRRDTGRAVISAKEGGVAAGIAEARWFLEEVGVDVEPRAEDGGGLEPGDALLELEGPVTLLLGAERTALNLLQRMSGIATATRRLVDLIEGAGLQAQVAATRKTPWPLLDKRAVTLGGGLSHRLGLADAILVKTNHLAELAARGSERSIETALMRAWRARRGVRFIEVEVRDRAEAVAAARVFDTLLAHEEERVPCAVMLDNLSPEGAAEAVAAIEGEGLRDSIVVEASGSVGEGNVVAYARAGADVVSVGALTHSPRALDLHQTTAGGAR